MGSAILIQSYFWAGGLRDCETEVILSILPEKKRCLLEVAISRGAKWISIDRRLASCGMCGELFAQPIVTYTQNKQRMELHGVCPNCGDEHGIEWSEYDELLCPRCGAKRTLQLAGFWD